MTASEILNGGNLTASDIIGAADQTGHVFHGNQWVKTGGLPWQGADTKWQPGGSYPEDAKLKAFAEKVHQDTHQRYLDEFGNPDRHQHYVKVKHGSKFDKVDVGGSGAFMVEKGTGQIYGVKAYGVVHPGKRYGTLDTIQEYNWGNHHFPVRKDAPKPRVGTPVKPLPSHGTSHRSDYFQEHHADGSISLAASQQLTAADILRAGAPVGNRNAAGEHKFTEGLHGLSVSQRPDIWSTRDGKRKMNDEEFTEHVEKRKAEDEARNSFNKTVTQVLNFASSASPSNAIQARAASDVIYAGATHSFTVTASSQWELGKPVEFMYMPGGVHTICAHFRGQAIKLTVSVDPSDAAKVLNGSLEQLRASYKHPPFGCVEHEEKDASVWAKQFTAKGDGVYLAADPSELGVRHVNGLVHRSWSPSFLTDADYSKATLADGTYQFPVGVRGSESNPAKITGCAFCLGTLTNKPAFREMSPVKAREATVKATGTSEGVLKSWAVRRGGVTYQEEHPQAYSKVAMESHSAYESERKRAIQVNRSHRMKNLPPVPMPKPTSPAVARVGYDKDGNWLGVVPHDYESEDLPEDIHETRWEPITNPSYAVKASDAIQAAESTGPQPFNASALLDVARALRVAHWNGNTATNEHEALGELYDAWEDGLDQLAEAIMGKRGCKVSEPAQGNTALAEQALSALSGVKDTLTAEDDDLLNIVADMENAVNKGRYLLKAKEFDMTASELLKASKGGQPGNQNAAGPHSRGKLSVVPHGYTHAFVSLGEDKEAHVKPFTRESDAWAEHSLAKSIGGPKRIALMKVEPNDTHETIIKKVSKAWPDAYKVNVHDDEVRMSLGATDSSPSPSLVRAITAADILNHLAPDGADGKPAVQ